MFFSEEKNQKTFCSAQVAPIWPGPRMWEQRNNKSLLVLFFRKELLAVSSRIETVPDQERINHEGTKAQSYHEGEIFVTSFAPSCLRGKNFLFGRDLPGQLQLSSYA
jgi:hypothetical protein